MDGTRSGTTQAAVEAGIVKPLEEWDVQELAMKRPRDKNGGFFGKAPVLLTPYRDGSLVSVEGRDFRQPGAGSADGSAVPQLGMDEREEPARSARRRG